MQLTLADWTDPKSLAGKPDQELFNAIRNGKGEVACKRYRNLAVVPANDLSFPALRLPGPKVKV